MTNTENTPERRKTGQFVKRIPAKTRDAIVLMVWEAKTQVEAALAVGMKLNTLQRNMRQPHIRKLYNQEFNKLRSGAAVQSYIRIANRGANATSETVAQRADEWIAGVDGISPVKKVEGNHSHSVTFGGFAFARDTVDVTPDHDTTSADTGVDSE